MIHVDSIFELEKLEEILFSGEWEFDPHVNLIIECGKYPFRYTSKEFNGRFRIITL